MMASSWIMLEMAFRIANTGLSQIRSAEERVEMVICFLSVVAVHGNGRITALALL
jgi:hypothetical protein